MAGVRFVNPYAGRSAAGDVLGEAAKGIGSIAQAVISKYKSPEEINALAENAALRKAHARLYDEQTAEHAAKAAKDRASMPLSGDALMDAAALTIGVPRSQIADTISKFKMPAGAFQIPDDQVGPVLPPISEDEKRVASLFQAYSDRNRLAKGAKDFDEMAGGVNERDLASLIRRGVLDPTLVRQSEFAATGKGVAPFGVHEWGSGNVVTGALTESPYGAAHREKVGAEKLANLALAGERGAHGRLYDEQGNRLSQGLTMSGASGGSGGLVKTLKGYTENGEPIFEYVQKSAGAEVVGPQGASATKISAQNADVDKAINQLEKAAGSVEKGVGLWSAVRRGANRVQGVIAPGSDLNAGNAAADEATQDVREAVRLTTMALANSKMSNWTQQQVMKMLPNPDDITQNPQVAKKNLQSVVALLRESGKSGMPGAPALAKPVSAAPTVSRW